MTQKQVASSLVSIFFNILDLVYNKNKMYKFFDSRDMLNFDFLKKGLGIVFTPLFVFDFSRKVFLVLHFSWPNFIAWLPLLLEILFNMCIVITW